MTKIVSWGSRLSLICAAAVALSGCAHSASSPTEPFPPLSSATAPIADRTALDEKLVAGVELAYRTMRIGLEAAVDTGLLKGGNALVAAQMDLRAVAAVEAVHAAYDAGNAETYLDAVTRAYDAIDAARDVIKGD